MSSAEPMSSAFDHDVTQTTPCSCVNKHYVSPIRFLRAAQS